MQITGSTALVTGAAHRVGRGIALALAREGADIILHYGSSADRARETAAEIAGMGVRALAVQADLGDPGAITRLFATTAEAFGGLDILVNSAASFDRMSFDSVTPEDWDRSMAINLKAPFLASQAAAPLMRARPRGREQTALIVNICDLSGVYPWRGYIQHGVSKAGLIHLTRISARELAPAIRVNGLILGAILPPPGMSEEDPRWSAMVDSTPLKRDGSPDLVGKAVVYLAQNDYITGELITLDGGESLVGAGTH